MNNGYFHRGKALERICVSSNIRGAVTDRMRSVEVGFIWGKEKSVKVKVFSLLVLTSTTQAQYSQSMLTVFMLRANR